MSVAEDNQSTSNAATDTRPGLLILTPSADLYGSDRALLHALPAILDEARVVILSAVDGPFVDQAREAILWNPLLWSTHPHTNGLKKLPHRRG